MESELYHLSLTARVLRFRNTPGMYPVNSYQSLVLASAAEIAAAAFALRHERAITSLSAWEPCCGGGATALALKEMGLGYVQATDVNRLALAACRENASLNGLVIDRIDAADLLDDGSNQLFDLICCNPPCGVKSVVMETSTDQSWKSVDGGSDGMDVTITLLRQSVKRLTAMGSLIVIVVSTGNVLRLAQELNEVFPNRWRVISPTPVAAPWIKADDSGAVRLRATRGFTPFVWERPDGWLWRLSWVVEASMGNSLALTGEAAPESGFPLRPFGINVDHDEALERRMSEANQEPFWLGPRGKSGESSRPLDGTHV